jgi:hypothetical protein
LDLEAENVSIVDIASLASTSSAASVRTSLSDGRLSGSKKDDFARHIRRTTSSEVRRDPKTPAICLIPGRMIKPHEGHPAPKGGTCIVFWGPICRWLIGEIVELEDFCKRIDEETDLAEREKLMKYLTDALVMLATGTAGGSRGIRSNEHNTLAVPNPHAIFYDVGLNWIIAPIMTEDEMKNWNGEPYPVAIIAGEALRMGVMELGATSTTLWLCQIRMPFSMMLASTG